MSLAPHLRVETDATPSGTKVFVGTSAEPEHGVQLVRRVGRKTYVVAAYRDAEIISGSQPARGDFTIAMPGFSLQTKEDVRADS